MHTMKNINLAWLLVAALALGVAACDVEQNSQNTPEPQTSTETEQPAADAGVDTQGDGAEVAEPEVNAEATAAVAPEQTADEAAEGDAAPADEAAEEDEQPAETQPQN